MTPQIAKVLISDGKISTLRDLALCSVSGVVRRLHLSLGFEKQLLVDIDIEMGEDRSDGDTEAANEKKGGKDEEDCVDMKEDDDSYGKKECEEGKRGKIERDEKERKLKEGKGARGAGGGTRDEDILRKLTAFASCLINGARYFDAILLLRYLTFHNFIFKLSCIVGLVHT